MTHVRRMAAASSASSPVSVTSAPARVVARSRDAAIDHLRIVLTVLVILHHGAIAYGGSGGWYWREQPDASSLVLLMFNAVNQSYFMGFFFLLAGYFTPAAYERKGAARFLGERVVRLGIPLLVFFFLLNPLTIALARMSEGHPFWSGWWQMIQLREWGPGPLWFAEALLIFALAYAGWRALARRGANAVQALPRFVSLFLIALALGATSFLVRLWLPVGQTALWLQLGYFPCYIFLFAAGCAASRARLLERVSLAECQPWLVVTGFALLTLPIVMLTRFGQGGFEGGWNFNALYYAFWDPLVAWGVILGLLWSARNFANKATPLTAWLAANAYGAFILHAPILVACSVAARSWALPPLPKFLVVGALASALSFVAGAAFRAIPGARRIL